MRRVIQEFMEPTIERITRDREMSALLSKRLDHVQKKFEVIENAVIKSGTNTTVFDEINITIAENEKHRKIAYELIKQEMQNVSKQTLDQAFIAEQQAKLIKNLQNKMDDRKTDMINLNDELVQYKKEVKQSILEVKTYADSKEISFQKEIRLVHIELENMQLEQKKVVQQSEMSNKQMQRVLGEMDKLNQQIQILSAEKLAIMDYEIFQADIKQQLYNVNTVMDEFSNEFLRLENYIEKYIPLRVQNSICETLENVLSIKDKAKLRDFEEKKFYELRNLIIEDKGLPNLIEEIRGIISSAGKYDPNFNKMLAGEDIEPEAQGMQEERLIRHKHMHIISQNMMKLNPTDYKEKRKDMSELKKIMEENNNNDDFANTQSFEGQSLVSFQKVQHGDESSQFKSQDHQESTFEKLIKQPMKSGMNKMNAFQVQMRNAIIKMKLDDAIKQIVERIKIESGQMLEYGQNCQTQLDKQQMKMEKYEERLKLVYKMEIHNINEHLQLKRDSNAVIKYSDQREYEPGHLEQIKKQLYQKIKGYIQTTIPYSLIKDDVEREYYDQINNYKRLHLSLHESDSPSKQMYEQNQAPDADIKSFGQSINTRKMNSEFSTEAIQQKAAKSVRRVNYIDQQNNDNEWLRDSFNDKNSLTFSKHPSVNQKRQTRIKLDQHN
ncbi:UNKNOWN [Stylonychia lemnae]|uniref:Uncharacterized protein n=1 Tax=Stylonychia lemnae TaxID=5949 RepID=A0A078A6Q3_STYLE|nr:UNKNOWN [Stylonychia lemnae]|eukprot:CDW76419.1 UNKNOWN [Stylonychia lemnae]